MSPKYILSKFTLVLLLFLGFMSCNSENKELAESEAAPLALDTAAINRYQFNSSIRAIFPVDDKECWFGGSKGMWGYTSDGGKSWTIDSIQHADHESIQFRSIAVTDKAVFLFAIGSPALLYQSTDKGKNWSIVYQENDSLAFYDAMIFRDQDVGFAMGDPTDGCMSVIKTTDSGISWSKIPCEILPQVTDGEAAFAASNSNIDIVGNNVWIVSGGTKARVFHSPDLGESWKVYETPLVQGGAMTGIFGCDFFDENNGIIIGGNWEDKELNRGTKSITKDGGKTWSLIAEGKNPGYRSCVQFIDNPKQILACGIPGISFSSDGGHQWQDLSSESFYTFRKSQNVIWLGGDQKIARWPIR